jgi:hypothetical protein
VDSSESGIVVCAALHVKGGEMARAGFWHMAPRRLMGCVDVIPISIHGLSAGYHRTTSSQLMH